MNIYQFLIIELNNYNYPIKYYRYVLRFNVNLNLKVNLHLF